MKKVKTFLKLSYTEKFIFFKAFILSAYVRFVTRYFPMSWWCKSLIGEQIEFTDLYQRLVFTSEERKQFHKTKQMVRLACRYASWETKCLVESILLKRLFKIKKVPIFLGINKINDKYIAHAWIGLEKSRNNGYEIVSVHV